MIIINWILCINFKEFNNKYYYKYLGLLYLLHFMFMVDFINNNHNRDSLIIMFRIIFIMVLNNLL